MLDGFGQWALADWPRKIHSAEQLTQELADEAKDFGSAADFGYGKYGGYENTTAKATGFFHVEQSDGRWWFVDPEGHLFLSTGINGTPAGRTGAGRFGGRPTGDGRQSGGCQAGESDQSPAGFLGHDHGRRGAAEHRLSPLAAAAQPCWGCQTCIRRSIYRAAIDSAANTQSRRSKNDPW